MSDWVKKKLGDIAKEVRDTYEPNQSESIPYVGLEHIAQQDLKLIGTGKSSDTLSTKRKFKNGDILFGSLRPYFRKVVRPKFDGVCSTDITVIRSKNGVDQGFLNYLIASKDFIDHSDKISSGSRMPRANWKVLEESEWNVPDEDTQQEIASILSAFDDLIGNNTRRIEILEKMAWLIYREWFVHYRYPGYENDRLVDSRTEWGEVPEGWEVKTLEHFGRIETGKTPRKKDPENYGDHMPFIKTPDMHDQFFVINTSDNLSEVGAKSQKKKTLPPNSICVSCIGTAGVIALTSVPSQTNQQINSIILVKEFYREFLYYAIKDLRPLMEKIGSTGATMTNVSKGKFQALEVLWPGDDLIQTYHEKVTSMFDQIHVLQKQNLKLKETRDILLSKLISGKVRV